MDADEIAALAATLGKAMAEGLAEGLAANDVAKEERAAAARQEHEAAEETKRVAEQRVRALRHVTEVFERDRKLAGERAAAIVRDYCRQARSEVLDALRKDSRMPRSINYLERYGALAGMDDRRVVLGKIESTLDLADEILAGVEHIDAQGALVEAAETYAQRVMRLDGICVSDPDRLSEVSAAEETPAVDDEREQEPPELVRVIEAAFAESLGELPVLEAEKAEEVDAARAREQLVSDQIDAASRAAAQAAEALEHSEAEGVAGAVLRVEAPAAFGGEAVLEAVGDAELLRALSAEVRKSFGTFSQVVQDNGLFSAFSNEGSYGACKGVRSSWWFDDLLGGECYEECYDEYLGEAPGRRRCDDIPTGVKEAQGGDSAEMALERMRDFNKQKYWGMLDDDFQQHVDAFWYGFKKLMEGVNGLFKLDTRPFGAYCDQLSADVAKRAAELGRRMDARQVSAFCEEVERRIQSA